MNLIPLLPPILGQTCSPSMLEFIAAQVTTGRDLPVCEAMLTPLIMPCCWPSTKFDKPSSREISCQTLLATNSDIATLSPVLISKPDNVISVSPHAPSTSCVIVASSESPTTNEEVIIAEAITKPAISKAA